MRMLTAEGEGYEGERVRERGERCGAAPGRTGDLQMMPPLWWQEVNEGGAGLWQQVPANDYILCSCTIQTQVNLVWDIYGHVITRAQS